jgi:hypothetical protein
MSTSNSFPGHARLDCRTCFASGCTSPSMIKGKWHIENNPMSWGSPTPKTLVLGFSKGSRQSRPGTAFEDIPFADFRPELNKALRVLKLLGTDDCIENHLGPDEKDWAFGSMVRCSLGLVDENGDVRKSGNIIPSVVGDPQAAAFVSRCAERYLARLPPRLKTVVMLSNWKPYVDLCFNAVRKLHPDAKRTSDVSYAAAGVSWVHIVHVGGPGVNHRNNWMAGNSTLQGKKRLWAEAELGRMAKAA